MPEDMHEKMKKFDGPGKKKKGCLKRKCVGVTHNVRKNECI